MFQKSRILAVAALTAGTVGLCASAAYAGTGTGDSGGLVNASHNQVPIQGCGNDVPVNVLGVQVPVNRVAGALGVLSTEPNTAIQDSSCKQVSLQDNSAKKHDPSSSAQSAAYHMSGDGWQWNFHGPSGDRGGLVNVSHNQVPVQVCNNHVPVNVLGVQVPVDEIAASLGILAPATGTAVQNSSCKQGSAQDNN